MIKIGEIIKNKIEPEQIKKKLLELDTKRRIKFIVLFGSVASRKNNPLSDIDIAVYYEGTSNQRFDFRIKACGNLPDYVDAQIFQDLPLYIQVEVLKGKILYLKSKKMLLDVALKTIQEYEDFRPIYLRSIGMSTKKEGKI
ncbi:nucleotidyltransferase domain-containing protein [Candidatus Woesearchaeota archaeon]|nr:nucleotidyltransferase domain-containing protein [Candidatus Woesearchaeota archaeon]